MREVRIIVLISAMAWLTGCAGVVSLHPLVLPNGKDTVFEPALVGTWEEVKAESDGTKSRYTVARVESGYSVTAAEPENFKGTMHLMKVGDRYLMDIYCESDGPPPPVHVFFKLRLAQDTAWVAEMDSDWLKDKIRTSGQLRNEVLAEADDRMVLTASPSELRQHLLPLFSDERSFGDEAELRRVK